MSSPSPPVNVSAPGPPRKAVIAGTAVDLVVAAAAIQSVRGSVTGDLVVVIAALHALDVALDVIALAHGPVVRAVADRDVTAAASS